MSSELLARDVPIGEPELPITLTAGPAFTLPPLPRENRDEVLKQYTDEIMCRIAALLPEQYRGVYADHPRLKELLQQQNMPGT